MEEKRAIITVGLPGCGKSYMRNLFIEGCNRTWHLKGCYIERDLIRDVLFGIFESPEKAKAYYADKKALKGKEKEVTETYDLVLDVLMRTRRNVIILSDTFLNPKTLRKYARKLKEGGFHVTVYDMRNVPFEVVLERNLKRDPARRVDGKVLGDFLERAKRMDEVIQRLMDDGLVDRWEIHEE